jgi:hypothetical protein
VTVEVVQYETSKQTSCASTYDTYLDDSGFLGSMVVWSRGFARGGGTRKFVAFRDKWKGAFRRVLFSLDEAVPILLDGSNDVLTSPLVPNRKIGVQVKAIHDKMSE